MKKEVGNSIYDAVKAGFDKIVMIIKKENEEAAKAQEAQAEEKTED